VLGNMPTEQVMIVLRAMPPKQAVGVLLAMTPDRVDALLSHMDDYAVGSMLKAAEPQHCLLVLKSLAPPRVGGAMAAMPFNDAVQLLASLPEDWVMSVLDAVHPEYASALIDALPATIRAHVVEAMNPDRATTVRLVSYCNHAIQALDRYAVTLIWLADDIHGPNLVAHALNRTFGIAVRYIDDTLLTMQDVISAETAVSGHAVDATLIITNAAPLEEVVRYQTHEADRGHLVQAVTWSEGLGEGVLGRALVRLA